MSKQAETPIALIESPGGYADWLIKPKTRSTLLSSAPRWLTTHTMEIGHDR